MFLDGLIHQVVRRGVGPLHLIIDDSGNDEVAVRIFRIGQLEMMALLRKSLLQQPGSQHQIGINAGQIEKISANLAGHRIDGFVRIGKGIDKGLQSPFH